MGHQTTDESPRFAGSFPGRAKRFLKNQAKRSLYALGAWQPPAPPPIEPEMPQARLSDHGLLRFEARDWREYCAGKLCGKGLEIGPLHRPMVRHEKMEIDYIDRFTVEELRHHYPELNALPLVEPTIIGDAETLAGVPDRSYDFVIAAHVIEHMRNPIGSFAHWCRVCKKGGTIYLVVPDKRFTFDRRRVRTTLEHIVFDSLHPSKERDFEHFLEWTTLVLGQEGNTAVKEAERLIEMDYSVHFHVFLPSDITRLLSWYSENVTPIRITEGPVMAPGTDEFHLLVQVL